MQPSQQNNQSNILELKSIFQLFDIDNTQEIDIKQINQIIRGLETLPAGANPQQLNFLTVDQVLTTPQQPQPTQQQQQVINLPPQYQNNSHGRRITLTKKFNSSENLEEAGKNYKSPENVDIQIPSNNQNTNYISVTELKQFPNNKATMSFPDFCDIFNECMSNKDQHEELLSNTFAVFDFDGQGYIDSKKIKQVFDVFKDKTSHEEIQNVLKFCGVINDRMTLIEFKEFFKKNL